jgi:phosphotransferase system  glucose/maltose/N-acetylglucosamine-specific IIC component
MLQNRVLYDLITPTVIFAGAILGCVISSRDSKLFAAEAGGVVGGLMAAIIQFQLQPFLRYWGLFVYIEYVVFGLIAGFICAKLFERLSGQRQV